MKGRTDYRAIVQTTLRERVLKAVGAAERAQRELVEANREIRELCNTLGITHPSAAKLATALRDTQAATLLLGELRDRLPR